MQDTITQRLLQFGDVVQIQNDDNIPTEIIGCLGYVIDATNQASILFRIYQPKTVGEWAEYSEHYLPSIALTFVGTVPSDMQPIL